MKKIEKITRKDIYRYLSQFSNRDDDPTSMELTESEFWDYIEYKINEIIDVINSLTQQKR